MKTIEIYEKQNGQKVFYATGDGMVSSDLCHHMERNEGQFPPDEMARIRVPAPVTDFVALLEALSKAAHAEGMEAFVTQEGQWFIIRKQRVSRYDERQPSLMSQS
jgi:hypothetical protein